MNTHEVESVSTTGGERAKKSAVRPVTKYCKEIIFQKIMKQTDKRKQKENKQKVYGETSERENERDEKANRFVG